VRLALVLAALGLYVLGGIALLGLGVWVGAVERHSATPSGTPYGPRCRFLVVGGLLHAAVRGVVVSVYFGRYVTGARRVATEVRIVTVANPAYRSEPSGPAEIRALAAAVNALADRRTAAEERADTGGVGSPAEHERARLAALVSQLRVGVVVCDEHGLVLLYNDAATPRPATATPSASAGRSSAWSTGRW
jgi:DNA polymerase-3 subunit epsilon